MEQPGDNDVLSFHSVDAGMKLRLSVVGTSTFTHWPWLRVHEVPTVSLA